MTEQELERQHAYTEPGQLVPLEVGANGSQYGQLLGGSALHLSQTDSIIPIPERQKMRGLQPQSLTPETDTDSKLNAAQLRDMDVSAAVRMYSSHTRVRTRLIEDQTGSAVVPPNADDSKYLDLMSNLYPVVHDLADQQRLCRMVQRGLDTYYALGGDGPTQEQEERLMDMSYAYERMFMSNIKLVIDLSYRYGYNLPLPEAVQYGTLGLHIAISRYDPDRNTKFSTYATPWVRRELMRNSAKYARAVRIPERDHNAWITLRQAENAFVATEHRAPTPEELGNLLDTTPEEVSALQIEGAIHLPSLNKKVGPDSERELGDILRNPEDIIAAADERVVNQATISRLISSVDLTPREAITLGLRYGITEGFPDTRFVPGADRRNKAAPSISYRQIVTTLITHGLEGDLRSGLSFEQIATITGVAFGQAALDHKAALAKLKRAAT